VNRLVVPLLSVVLVAGSACARLDGDDRSGRLGSPASSAAPSADATAQAATGARDAPAPELQEFYDQRVDWQPCEDDDFSCARIEVPLDYEDPAGDRIELALLKNPVDRPAERIGSMVVNPGGPGAPGTSYASSDDAWPAALQNRYDIVGFDPRGTGTSTAIDCLTDAELDAYIASDPDPDTPADVRAFMGWVRAMGAGCAEKSGDLAAHVSTHEAARDMDVIRAVLEEEKLTYFGASYGTKLGATYADLFPERSGRLVLDGAVDVSLSSRQSSIQQARGFEVALTAYVDDCLADDCYLGDSRSAAKSRIKGFLAEVEEEPIEVDDRELAIGNAFYGIVAPLYNDDYWYILDDALGAALEGDAEDLLWLSDIYTSRNDSGGYDDNSSEAIYAINCLDDPTAIAPGRIPGQYAAFEEASPTFGRVFAWGLTGCSGLAVDAPHNDWDLDAAGADPLLVIGTTRDPATPMRWARALAAQLDPAVLVTRDGDGHTGYNMKNPCVDEVVESYLVDGEVPDADVDCPAP
jgi:pimeloyl-ACP methyl ester carboxylesterase